VIKRGIKEGQVTICESKLTLHCLGW